MKTKFAVNKTSFHHVLFLALIGCTALSACGKAFGSFDPNANGVVHVIVVQPDGKILLGGDFTSLSPNGGSPIMRNHIARLNSDGTLDMGFNPNANSGVRALALQPDGKIIAGGDFTTMSGLMRGRIARLDASTGAADSFEPNANAIVRTIAVQADGKILFGGDFSKVSNEIRNFIARVDSAGTLESFNPAANAPVRCLAIQSDGKILVGGQFRGERSIGGEDRNCIARLDPNTALADSFNPNANDGVLCITLQSDGKILVSGGFHGSNSIGGQARNRVARLDPDTGAADSFDPNISALVNAIALQSDGKILVGGVFFGANSVGGKTRNYIARVDGANGAADAFDPDLDGRVQAIALEADGKSLAGGNFRQDVTNGQGRNRIARIDAATGEIE